MNIKDLGVTEIHGHYDQKGFTVCWNANIGFGQVEFRVKNDGAIVVDDECMGRDFVKMVLDRLVDRCVMQSDKVAGCTLNGRQIVPEEWPEEKARP